MRRIALLLCLLISIGVVAQTRTPETPLVVWLPDNLVVGSEATLKLFREQADAFGEAEGITIDLRVKKVADVGSILSTLRSASAVAPNALPTLTLLNRQDLMTAWQEDLIVPLQGIIPSDLLEQVADTRKLCQINGEFAGIPYLMEVILVAYRATDNVDYAQWDYGNFIARGEPLVFAGNTNIGLNSIVFSQYATSSNTVDAGNTLTYSESALRDLLTFYEQARQNTLITEGNINYTASSEYLEQLALDKRQQYVVTSTEYLRARQDDATLLPAGIPSTDDTPQSILDGWCWVIVTPNEAQQRHAAQFIASLENDQLLVSMALSTSMLPANPALLSEVVGTRDDELFTRLLQNARVLLLDPESMILERAIQTSFQGIVSGSLTVDEAIASVESQIGN